MGVEERLRVRVIGPVEVRGKHGWQGVPSAMQRGLLAALVLKANQVVTIHHLLEELWGPNQPASARSLVAGYVWRLRRAVNQCEGVEIATRAPGYVLKVPAGGTDISLYDRVVAQAHADSATDLQRAASGFTRALALWRGTPLADVRPSPQVMAAATRLEESRLAVQEARIRVELALGRHASVLPEIRQIVMQNPLREHLHEHLMLALYRTGQQATALSAYQELRRTLIEELGIEPGTTLRELYHQILRNDPTLLGDGGMIRARGAPSGARHPGPGGQAAAVIMAT